MLITRGDIRLQSLVGGAVVPILVDQVDDVDLVQIASIPLPTYNEAEDAMEFDGTQAIGASLSVEQLAAIASSAWAIFVLSKRPTIIYEQTQLSFGRSVTSSTPVLAIQESTTSGGLSRYFIRDNAGLNNHFNGVALPVDTWIVESFRYDGSFLYAGINGVESAPVPITADVANQLLDVITLGAVRRTSVSNYFTGFIREYRIYDSAEGGESLAANVASMLSGSSAGGGGGAIAAVQGAQDVAYGEDPGFTGNVNGANLKAGGLSVPLTLGASSTNSAPTFDLEDFTALLRDTPWVPFSGTQLEIEITSDDGGDAPVTRNIDLSLPADFAEVTLVSAVKTNGSAFYQSLGYDGPDFTPEDNAQMIYDNRFNTSISADGTLTTDRNGTEIKAWIYLPTPNLLVFYPFAAPAQTIVTVNGNPSTLEPNTQYTATVLNATSVCDGGQTFNSGTGYDVTIDGADLNIATFTTSASLPAGSPVQFKLNFPTA